MKSVWFVFFMMAALPILIVLINTLDRRYPSGFVGRYPWLPWLARLLMAAVYVAAAVEAYSRSAKVRGGLFMAAGVAVLAIAIAERWFRQLEKPDAK